MWKTVLLLLITIIVIPFVAFYFDEPLDLWQKTALADLLKVYLIAALFCFVVSSITNNHSQVDKLWSVLPVVYAWMICYKAGFEPRIFLMAIMVSVWGLRLSYNFSRRCGYSIKFWTGEEDYRWPVLQKKPEFAARWRWVVFNMLFISMYQLGLVLLITLPALKSMGGEPLTWVDYLLAGLILFFVITETIADQQQWKYHKRKNLLKEQGETLPENLKKGFVDSGLWGLVRHPNYASEQAVWIVFYFFSVAATGKWMNWSIIGAVLLVLLFWGSSNFSEDISTSKYPEYESYKKKVPRFIPFVKG
jgi:steroid 5-alpha reductase family enzyme